MTAPATIDGDVMTDELLPCPHCGAIAQVVEGQGPFEGRAQVECSACRISTFWYDEAVVRNQWNRRALLSASKPAAPEGWKLVPVEPTIEMQNAGDASRTEWHVKTPIHAGRRIATNVYTAMLAAAPAAMELLPGAQISDEEAKSLAQQGSTVVLESALSAAEPAQSGEPVDDDARNLVTLDRRDLWDCVRGAIHAALNDKIPKDCVVSWVWEEATYRTMDIFQKIVDKAPQPSQLVEAGDTVGAMTRAWQRKNGLENWWHEPTAKGLFEDGWRAAMKYWGISDLTDEIPSHPSAVVLDDERAAMRILFEAAFNAGWDRSDECDNAYNKGTSEQLSVPPKAQEPPIFQEWRAQYFSDRSEVVESLLARAASPQATPTQPCIAPGCHHWDGTDSCTCQKATATQPAQTERALTELSDEWIEMYAQRHIAPGAAKFRATFGLDVPYQQTEQFKRMKAYTQDVIRALLTAPQPASDGGKHE